MSAVPYSQEFIFLTSVFGGLLLGLLWDVYRLIRHYVFIGKVGTALCDILYWIVSLYVGLGIIVRIGWGNVRLYILLGFITGALVYFWLLSRTILNLAIYLIDFVIKIIIRSYNIVIFPIKFFIKRLKFLLLPYKMKLDTKIKSKKRELKFYIHKHKSNLDIKNRKKLKQKKIKRIMREQRKNAKRYKNNRAAGKK